MDQALPIESLFEPALAPSGAAAGGRSRRDYAESELILDDASLDGAVCAIHVSAPAAGDRIDWSLPAGHELATAAAGGYLVHSTVPGAPRYWLPVAPRRVERDALGRLLQLEPAPVVGLQVASEGISGGFAAGGRRLETIVWRLPPGTEVGTPGALERSAWYTLGSHTVVQGRVDIYRHLVAGTVYENRPAWPNRWRVFSENDGHALHLILGGWARATGEPMLQALRRQVLLAVLDRQSDDGGYRHGEWTELKESHYRLHCSAMHMMMDALQERRDAAVEQALRAGAAFLARQRATLSFGEWLLHDELEHSVEKMKLGPFSWVPSRQFGKAESNMLVLNSHLDATIALDRYAEVTGDRQFEALVQSARASARAVLGLRSAEWLYRAVFWLIGPTFLPAARARDLPPWRRALKRIAWKYVIPRLPDLKARFPRLVMPGGYIDRELTLRTFAHDYHAVNLMDLARYLRRFPDEPVARQVLLDGLAFVRDSGLFERWREMPYQKYALGFWAEALYHVCTLFPEARYRAWLAEAMLALEDLQMGQPPSLLGANAEAVPPHEQLPCPGPADARLRVANLGRRGAAELLVLNPTASALPLAWETPPAEALRIHSAEGRAVEAAHPEVPARSWLWARAAD